MLKNLAILVCAFFTSISHGEVITGVVTKVIDGCTIAVSSREKGNVYMVLRGLDKPDYGSVHERISRKFLSHLVLNKSIHADCKYEEGISIYSCVVTNNKKTDISALVLVNGANKHSKKFDASNQYLTYESQARKAKRRIWQNEPAAPSFSSTQVSNSYKKRSTYSRPKPSRSGCGKSSCSQMSSCSEARYYLNSCGVQSLDRDNDGIPCESLCD